MISGVDSRTELSFSGENPPIVPRLFNTSVAALSVMSG